MFRAETLASVRRFVGFMSCALTALMVNAGGVTPLPTIGTAPPFALTTQDERPLALAALHGKVVVVSFLFTRCTDRCSLLAAKLALLQGQLGSDFARRVHFVSISIDPEHDTPHALRHFATHHGARTDGWSFMTGTREEIDEVARRYGVVIARAPTHEIEHGFVTSVVDPNGMLRVQYLGTRFTPDDLLADIRSLLRERAAR